ncbi:MAG TPA: TetR/AcrR family transcriptional regulator [Acidimicrobiales bacterium]|jgi:AcrR family transcriptional regulator|nr:TetR/AcrR family transcriptional regulator [Acidimicrobiales bacterium]
MATTARPGKEETRARIVTAALQALRADGIAGISARAIARHGGFNQALIFYHFGSLEGLLVAVARRESERRSALYAPALREVTSLPELVAVARRLHDEEFAAGSVAALTQMLAGAVGSDELARGVWAALEPWTTLVQGTVERLLADTPYRDALPLDDLTFAITALFLGVELLTGLDPNGRQTTLFATMESAAALVDGLVRGSPAATTTEGVSPPAAR